MDERRYERLASLATATILEGFDEARNRFDEITARARRRFEQRDWHGMMADMSERLGVHSAYVNRIIERLEASLGDAARREALWTTAVTSYAKRLAPRRNRRRRTRVSLPGGRSAGGGGGTVAGGGAVTGGGAVAGGGAVTGGSVACLLTFSCAEGGTGGGRPAAESPSPLDHLPPLPWCWQ